MSVLLVVLPEASTRVVLPKKIVLKIMTKFTGKNLCQGLLACNFIEKETLAQVFPCKFYGTPLVVASVL